MFFVFIFLSSSRVLSCNLISPPLQLLYQPQTLDTHSVIPTAYIYPFEPRINPHNSKKISAITQEYSPCRLRENDLFSFLPRLENLCKILFTRLPSLVQLLGQYILASLLCNFQKYANHSEISLSCFAEVEDFFPFL